ncbi:MAG: hypothetical protein JWQ72_2987 [Polaromonas sp.]|nr:hypothetical protein [Polaromonas sp.]
MSYTVRIFAAEDVPDSEREQARVRFCAALEDLLGGQDMVAPVYAAYLRLLNLHGEHPRPWPVSAPEQVLVEQWEAAELAATQAAFGKDRYMGDADYELVI